MNVDYLKIIRVVIPSVVIIMSVAVIPFILMSYMKFLFAYYLVLVIYTIHVALDRQSKPSFLVTTVYFITIFTENIYVTINRLIFGKNVKDIRIGDSIDPYNEEDWDEVDNAVDYTSYSVYPGPR